MFDGRGDRMTWWRITAALAGALLPLTLEVGTVEARPRLAFLTLSAPQEGAQLIDAFVDGLRRLGYVEGRNAAGDVERLEPLAQELTALHPDVLVGSEPSAARPFKNVAPTLPIVSMALTDALIPELIASYARPGGNGRGSHRA
jgi:ABC-type uncharacterized transport system substrate-binding protein